MSQLPVSDAVLRSLPWNSVFMTAQPMPPHVAAIPTMLTPEEQRMLVWLTQHAYRGNGAIVDLGAFFGGSTGRMAYGLVQSGLVGQVHSYDRFEITPDGAEKWLFSKGIPRFDGTDMLPASRAALAPIGAEVHLHKGDIMQAKWDHGPIEVLHVDICKNPATTDHIARQFYPALIPGALVVQQDYLHFRTPWVIAQMAQMAECFEMIVPTEHHSVLFRCLRPVTAADLDKGRTQGLSDMQLKALILDAARQMPFRRAQELVLDSWFALDAVPNARQGHQFQPVQRNAARYAALLAQIS
jgi:hypothetical protein